MAAPTSRPPLRRSALVVGVAAIALTIIGITMVIWGWSMETPSQVAAVRWALVPITLSVLGPVAQMAAMRRVWRGGARWLYATLAVCFIAGFAWMILAISNGVDSVLPSAIAWTALGVAFLHLASIAVVREVRTVKWEQAQRDTDDGLTDEPAVSPEALRGEDIPDDADTDNQEPR